MEISERIEAMGGIRLFSGNLTASTDTSRYIVKQVTTEDSIYTFTLDKNDPNTMSKTTQFIIKYFFTY